MVKRKMFRAIRATIMIAPLIVLLGIGGRSVVKTALDGKPEASPVIRRNTTLLFTSIEGPYDPNQETAVGYVRNYEVDDPELARQFRHLDPGLPIKIRFKNGRITGVEILGSEVPETKAAGSSDSVE